MSERVGNLLQRTSRVLIAAVLASALLSTFSHAHAEDSIEILAGGWITHYDGVLISRSEEGDIGEIEFGARSAITHQLAPTPRVGPHPVGNYSIRVIPHDDSVQGFVGEPCRRIEAVFHHVSGSTYMRFVCP